MRLVARLAVLPMLLAGAVEPSAAQPRLFAGTGERILELGTAPSDLGRVTRTLALPACGAASPGASPTVVAHGLYLAWQAPDRVCVLGLADGRVREVRVPAGLEIVAAGDRAFRLILAPPAQFAPAELLVLNEPDGSPRTLALPAPASVAFNHYAIAEAAQVLLVAQGEWGNPFGGAAPAVTLLRYDLRTGVLLSTVRVSDLFVQAIAVDPASSRLLVTSSSANRAIPGVFSLDPATGRIVASTTAIQPHLAVSDTRRVGGPSIVMAEGGRLAALVTYDGAVVLDTGTLVPLGTLDVPKARVPLPQGFDAQTLGFQLLYDEAAGVLFAVELEGRMWSYYPGECVRSTLFALPLGGRPHVADLAAILGRPVCGFGRWAFLVPSPERPGVQVEVSAPGGVRTVDLSWAPAAGAVGYVVEAGLAPGVTSVTFEAPGTALHVDHVPPATYYVRVRAVGAIGQTTHSAERVVVVP